MIFLFESSWLVQTPAGYSLKPLEMNSSSQNGVARACSAAYRLARCPHSTPTFCLMEWIKHWQVFCSVFPSSCSSSLLPCSYLFLLPHHLFMEHIQLPLLMAGNDTWTQKWQWVVSTHQLGTEQSAWATASALCQLRCSGLINTGQCDENAPLQLEYISVKNWYIKHLNRIFLTCSS